jgi:hypothetical protein
MDRLERRGWGESPAVIIARAHVDAWGNTDLSGADDYMAGLMAHAQPIPPGSGERCNARRE